MELGQGFDGYLSYHEVCFSVLDANVMVLAPVIFNFWWPAKYVDGVHKSEEIKMKDVGGLEGAKLMRQAVHAQDQFRVGVGSCWLAMSRDGLTSALGERALPLASKHEQGSVWISDSVWWTFMIELGKCTICQVKMPNNTGNTSGSIFDYRLNFTRF